MPPTCNIFGTPGPASIYATDLNDAGVACGYWNCPGSFTRHAWVWDSVNGFRSPALPPGATTTAAYAISEAGGVYGTFGHPQGGGIFRSVGASVTTVDVGMASMDDANDAEVFTGTWGPLPGVWAPFRWSAKGGFQDLRPLLGGRSDYGFAVAISADGTACGWYRPTAQSFFKYGFLIGPDDQVEVVPPVAGGLSSELVAINNDNAAAGYSRIDMVAGGLTLGFIYKDGQTIAPPNVQVPGDPNTYVCYNIWDIADDGTYIGGWRSTFSSMFGLGICIVRHEHVYPFYPLLGNVIGTQIVGPTVSRMNNAGQIIGSASLPGGVGVGVVFIATPVPLTPGDTDCNQTVNVADLLNVIGHWQDDGGRPDVNDDGVVDLADLVQVIDNWSFDNS